MAILSAVIDGVAEFRSANGPGASEEERARAITLDKKLSEGLAKLGARARSHRRKMARDGAVETYWEFGRVIRDIFESEGVDPRERLYYYVAVRRHADERFLAKDRGPARLHVHYCYRLSGFSRERAISLKWGEWVYLFDSPGINAEPRFDRWLDAALGKFPGQFDRQSVRILAQTINAFFSKSESRDLDDEEIARAYDAAWRFTVQIRKPVEECADTDWAVRIRTAVREVNIEVGETIAGALPIEKFASLLVDRVVRNP